VRVMGGGCGDGSSGGGGDGSGGDGDWGEGDGSSGGGGGGGGDGIGGGDWGGVRCCSDWQNNWVVQELVWLLRQGQKYIKYINSDVSRGNVR